jgi:hypothetical protein
MTDGTRATAVEPTGGRFWAEAYQARVEAAKAFLRSLSVSVVRADRDALVPGWLVSGYSGAFSNEQLVELAEARGFGEVADV